MKKIIIVLNVIILSMLNSICVFASNISASYTPDIKSRQIIASNPSIIQTKLEEAMVKLLNNPSSLTVKLTPFSKEESLKGHFKKVYVHTSGGNIEKLRLEKADIYFDDVQLNVEKLLNKEKIDPISMKNINMDVVITEKDLNAFLLAKSKSIKVRRPKVKMKPNKIELSGATKYGLVRVHFWASGVFKIKDKKEIWFYAKRMKINRFTMPRSFVGAIVKRINPVLKLNKFPFKLNLTEIRIERGKMIFTSFRKGKVK